MKDFRQLLVPPNLIPGVIGWVLALPVLGVVAYGALHGLAILLNAAVGG